MIIGVNGNEANVSDRVGVNQYAAELLHALYRLPQAKKHQWVVYLASPPLPHLPKERKGWSYKVLPGDTLWVFGRLTPHLWSTSKRPDILFTPSHYTPPFLPFPQVLSIMDLGYLHFPEQFRRRDFIQLKYWGGWSMRQAKKIIAISESTKEEIENHYPWARGKVEVTYPGYDKTKFKDKISKIKIKKVKEKYGIGGEYILFLSTLKPSKNVEGLLEAYRLLDTDSRLVIAGKKGWLYEEIFSKAKQLGLEEKVVFTGFVSEEDKPGLLAGAKVLASPSFWEGFGMHVLEAMACGTPVVVSSAGSLPEIVQDAGIFVDPNSPKDIAKGLKKVVTATQNQYNPLGSVFNLRYNMLVGNVVSQAEKFSWEKTARETLKILQKAV